MGEFDICGLGDTYTVTYSASHPSYYGSFGGGYSFYDFHQSKRESNTKYKMLQNKILYIKYRCNKGIITERKIKVISYDGWYITAYCYLRKAKRQFNKTRILEIKNPNGKMITIQEFIGI